MPASDHDPGRRDDYGNRQTDSASRDARLPRRGFLGGAVAAMASGAAVAQGTPVPTARPTRTVRFAHLTDIHLQPERNAEAGFAACLAHVQSLSDPPKLIITGGDNVMDVFEQPRARAEMLRAVWRRSLANGCSLRVEPTVGNHDILGWHTKSGIAADDPLYGKAFACDLLGLARTFRSFEVGGWRVVILDSIQPRPNGYVAEIDAEQRAWLTETLTGAATPMPTVVISHVPILSVTPLLYGTPRKDDVVQMSGGLVHADGTSLHSLLKGAHVQLCLSGHTHLLDRIETEGVTYVCDGAVSGNWWKGAHHDVPEGYGIVDLFDDGSWTHSYMPFGWAAAPA